jgi:hypothetical protein
MAQHDIPDRWLGGMARQGYTMAEAVVHWAEQERLERQHNAPTAEHLNKWTTRRVHSNPETEDDA